MPGRISLQRKQVLHERSARGLLDAAALEPF